MKTLLQKIKDGGFDCAVVYADGSGFLMEKDPVDYKDEHKYQFDEIEEAAVAVSVERIRRMYALLLQDAKLELGGTSREFGRNLVVQTSRTRHLGVLPVAVATAFAAAGLGWVLGETEFGAEESEEPEPATDAPQPAAVSSPQPSSSS